MGTKYDIFTTLPAEEQEEIDKQVGTQEEEEEEDGGGDEEEEDVDINPSITITTMYLYELSNSGPHCCPI